MMVVTPGVVLALTRLQPFHELLQLGLVKRRHPNSIVTFISHQWLARAHPDPEGMQLRTLQDFLQAGARLQLRQFFSEQDWTTFKTAVASPAKTGDPGNRERLSTVLLEDFSRHGPNAPDEFLAGELAQSFLWMDFLSVPQEDDPCGGDGQLRAIQSIPCYIEQSSYFIVLCPNARHADSGELCDFESWLRRGWCRFEVWCNVMSHQRVVPLVLTNTCAWTIGIDDFVAHCGQSRTAVVGCGEFSCCRWNHKRADGTSSPCDLDLVLPILEKMWLSKVKRAATARNPFIYSLLRTMETQLLARSIDEPFRATWGTGPADDATPQTVLERLEQDRLAGLIPQGHKIISIVAELGDERLLQACVAKGEDPLTGDHDGDTCLIAACSQSSLAAVEYLLSLPCMTVETVNRQNKQGKTALHLAVRNGCIVRALLRCQADPSLRNFLRMTPLHTAARFAQKSAVGLLLEGKSAADAVDSSGMTALHHAAEGLRLLGRQERDRLQVMQHLLEHGASASIRNIDRLTASDMASRNGFQAAVDLLDAHAASRSRRTRIWRSLSSTLPCLSSRPPASLELAPLSASAPACDGFSDQAGPRPAARVDLLAVDRVASAPAPSRLRGR